jgi:hypothetical protein
VSRKGIALNALNIMGNGTANDPSREIFDCVIRNSFCYGLEKPSTVTFYTPDRLTTRFVKPVILAPGLPGVNVFV